MTYDLNDAARDGKLPGDMFDPGPEYEPCQREEPSNVVPIRKESDTSSNMKAALTSTLEAIKERAARGGGLAGAACGLTELDDAIDGWQRGRFYVIGGRTGMGKSIVGLNVGMGLAKAGQGVDFLSLEMPTEEQALRALLCEPGVSHGTIKYGPIGNGHWSAMTNAIGNMCSWPWVWDDKGGVDTDWIAKHVEASRAKLKSSGKGELHSVVIDHVQKIRGKNAKAPRREQMVWIVDDLKQLAKRADVCVIALAQVGRGTEARGLKDRKPRMADLREAGAFEQEADCVVMLYREDYYSEPNEKKTNVIELALPKIRGGQPCLVKGKFDGSRYSVCNLEEHQEEAKPWAPR